MNTGLTHEEVKIAIEKVVGREARRTKDLRDIPFSLKAKDLLEAAESVCILKFWLDGFSHQRLKGVYPYVGG